MQNSHEWEYLKTGKVSISSRNNANIWFADNIDTLGEESRHNIKGQKQDTVTYKANFKCLGAVVYGLNKPLWLLQGLS